MLLNNKFIVFFASVLIAGFFMLLSPETSNAGALGCCINKSGNCAGGCGNEASDCATMKIGSCKNIVSESQCDATQGLVNCFVPGSVCNQETNTLGICGPGSGDPCASADDCPDPADTTCFAKECLSGGCVQTPTGDPSCALTTTAIIPTLSQWGMIVAAVIFGFFAVVMLWRSKDSEI